MARKLYTLNQSILPSPTPPPSIPSICKCEEAMAVQTLVSNRMSEIYMDQYSANTIAPSQATDYVGYWPSTASTTPSQHHHLIITALPDAHQPATANWNDFHLSSPIISRVLLFIYDTHFLANTK